MWVLKETDDELTVKAFPILMWGLVLVCLVLAAFVANFYLQKVGGVANIGKLFQGNISDILTNLAVMSFLPLCGLVLFHFSPLVITKFNRRERKLQQARYTLLGKNFREMGYDYLNGGVRVDSETREDSDYYSLFFETQTGEKINLSNEVSWWAGRTFDVAVKANEYLQTGVGSKK